MVRHNMAGKKAKQLTLEEKLQNALVPKEEQPYKIPDNWCWVYLTKGMAKCLDKHRKPINATERNNRLGNIPYYGATGQVGWIDDYLTNEQLVLIGEDGAPFFNLLKNKAYIINGKSWVNNHAHILKSFYGEIGNKYLCSYLNIFDYKDYINGTTRLKLTQKKLDIIPIPLAPLNEQQRIVNKIESLFAKLDKAKKLTENMLAQFEQNKMTILHKAFTGELTTKWRKKEYITKNSTWQLVNIKTVTKKIFAGGDVPKNNLSSEKNTEFNIPIYTNGEKNNGLYGYTNEAKVNNIAITISARGTIGYTAIRIPPFYPAIRLITIIPDLEKINIKFLYYIFTFFRVNSAGSSIPQLTIPMVKDYNFELPTIEEQQEIVNILDKLLAKYNKIQNLNKQLEQIELLKKSILAKAFRGELGTNDPQEESAEKLLAEILAEN